jgi:hypothetical protein
MEASDSRAGDDSSLIPDAVKLASFDPTASPIDQPMRRWWGRHLAETRWVAELAALVADPVYRGDGVQRGHGEPVVLIPGFLAGDPSLTVMGECWAAWAIGSTPRASRSTSTAPIERWTASTDA